MRKYLKQYKAKEREMVDTEAIKQAVAQTVVEAAKTVVWRNQKTKH